MKFTIYLSDNTKIQVNPKYSSPLFDPSSWNNFIIVNRVKKEIVRLRGVIKLGALAPVITDRVGKDAAITVEGRCWNGHAGFGEGF